MKKTIIFLVVAALTLSMILLGTACKTATETTAAETTAAETMAGETTAAETTAAETASSEIVEINYLTWASSETYPAKVIEAFEAKYPNIKVNASWDVQDVEAYIQKQKTAITAGSVDVTAVRDEMLKTYIDAGYLVDITGQSFLNDYNPGTLDMATVDGKIYGAPIAQGFVGGYYNKSIFDKNGLSLPKTWDEFIAVCEKIKSTGMSPMATNLIDTWVAEQAVYQFMVAWQLDYPDVFKKFDSGELKYTDAYFVDSFKAMNDFYKNYVNPESISWDYRNIVTKFYEQEVPIYLNGDYVGVWFTDVKKEAPTDFEMGAFAVPVPGSDEIIVPTYATFYQTAITSSKHPVEAMKLLEFMCSAEGAQVTTNALSMASPVKGVVNEVSWLLPMWKDVATYKTVPIWHSLQNPAVNAQLIPGLIEMFSGSLTPEKLAERLQNAQDMANASK